MEIHGNTMETCKHYAEPRESTHESMQSVPNTPQSHVKIHANTEQSHLKIHENILGGHVFTWLCEVFAWLPKGLETPERYLHVFSRGYAWYLHGFQLIFNVFSCGSA